MIKGYRDKRTRRFAEGKFVAAFQGIKRQAEKRLEILAAAKAVLDLIALRSNRFEALGGDKKGQYRICFEWLKDDDGPVNVEITDYRYSIR